MEKSIDHLVEDYKCIRKITLDLCSNLENEDFVIQSADFVSPPKWHLAHTTWFFETFILKKYFKNYSPFDNSYEYLFNSYYNSIGKQWERGKRGILSRPTVSSVNEYRFYVDTHMVKLFDCFREMSERDQKSLTTFIEIGIHHEQQHQELLLMDIRHNNYCNPLEVSYTHLSPGNSDYIEQKFIGVEGGVYSVGTNQKSTFSYDNETPLHQALIRDFYISNRPTTNSEFLEFVKDGGYENPLLWQSDGWAMIDSLKQKSPEYWRLESGQWQEFSLFGWTQLDLNSPVSHINYYEADAYASWKSQRLLTEYEWEIAFSLLDKRNTNKSHNINSLKPLIKNDSCELIHGGVWEWTSSSYSSYPMYVKPEGALGEYNSKFMNGQMVLRGSSFCTPPSHIRKTYRNFFYPNQSWAVSGVRLAKDF